MPHAPAAAQTPRNIIMHRTTTNLRFGTAAMPMHAIPEQGTLLQSITGPAVVTSVRGGTLTFRSNSGVMATLRMPASRIRLMRITTGTQLRLTTLNRQFMQIQVIGGRQRIPQR
jgi:hypothetical protein